MRLEAVCVRSVRPCVCVCAQFSAADESTAVLVEHLERLSDLCTENTRRHFDPVRPVMPPSEQTKSTQIALLPIESFLPRDAMHPRY